MFCSARAIFRNSVQVCEGQWMGDVVRVKVGFEGSLGVGTSPSTCKKVYARLEGEELVCYSKPPLQSPKGSLSLPHVLRITPALPPNFAIPSALRAKNAWITLVCANHTYILQADNVATRDAW